MYLSYTELCSVMLTGSYLLPTTKREKTPVLRGKQPLYASLLPFIGFFGTVLTIKHAYEKQQLTHEA